MPDKGFDRRTFIKACAGVSLAGAAAAAGLGMARPISDVNVQVKAITYPAIQVMKGSPAPYGLPLIPLRIEGNGNIVGLPDAAEGQLSWYKYCSHERAPGSEPDFETSNDLKYFVTEERLEKLEAWYKPFVEEQKVVNVDDFPRSEPSPQFDQWPGVGAPFKWRSDDVDREDTISGIIIRAPSNAIEFDPTRVTPDLQERILNEWFPEDPATGERFVAFCSFCTHFCCVPGFHEAVAAINAGFGERVFCTCHLSRYNPFYITQYDRQIFVFPEGTETESAARGAGH